MYDQKKTKRGFASIDPERLRQIARLGGLSVPSEKRSFSQNPELAAKAGKKGGKAVKAADRSFSRDHALASKAGTKGAQVSHKSKNAP